jgi:predicted RNase H-like nuclease (RuvC/YqgF family)
MIKLYSSNETVTDSKEVEELKDSEASLLYKTEIEKLKTEYELELEKTKAEYEAAINKLKANYATKISEFVSTNNIEVKRLNTKVTNQKRTIENIIRQYDELMDVAQKYKDEAKKWHDLYKRGIK